MKGWPVLLNPFRRENKVIA
jgi:hypothetical protein